MDHRSLDGVYDLTIASAGYDRDNGHFECRLVEGGTGRDLHSSEVDLVVLARPSPPSVRSSASGGGEIASSDPVTLTEGRRANLTCASVGGSPPPEITW